jgi:hypothetical protein
VDFDHRGLEQPVRNEGIRPEAVAEMVIGAVSEEQFYIVTDPQ